MEIQHGTLLTCETADGGHVTMRALGPAMQGIDFPVVWVCLPEDYEANADAEDGPRGIPWPLTAVHAVEDAEAVDLSAAGEY